MTNHYELLMRHHAWAAERLLDTAAPLPPARLEAPSSSHGTLLGTLCHVADVDQSWGRVARGLVPEEQSAIEQRLDSLASLRSYWLAEVASLVDFASGLSSEDLEREVRPPWKSHTYRVWQVLVHIATHRGEHGNQVGWQLTALGASPGELGFMGWVDLQRRGEA